MPKPKYKLEKREKKCRACHGLGYVEYQAGLIRLPCTKCNGTGKVTKMKRVYPPEKKDD